MYKILLFFFIVSPSLRLSAQVKPAIPLMRKIFHEDIDKTQKAIDKLDKKEDRLFKGTTDEEVNQQVSYALFNKVDRLQDLLKPTAACGQMTKLNSLEA